MIFLANTKSEQQSAETVAARPGWSVLDAVKNNQIVGLDDDIASRWGPRVVELVGVIAEAITNFPAGE
jgi:iron complex transport system substrate-binding protein